MIIAVFTHVVHTKSDKEYFGYGPYVKEMNLWFQNVSEVILVAPLQSGKPDKIDIAYQTPQLTFTAIPTLYFKSLKHFFKSIFLLPKMFFTIFRAMQKADHIHLRCPGNIGLLGCLVQIFFPKKKKSAKYAGNWDPNAKQPWSYRLQKYILSHTFLTKNMQVLVYGEWEHQSQNIKPFFTATYRESDKIEVPQRTFETIRFIFAGTLSAGKRPMYAVEIVQQLFRKGYPVQLDLYGEGTERALLENYIETNNLKNQVILHGNQNEITVRNAYQNVHFLLLPSKSEGWPKVVAEAMFWGCIPVATPVSCVSNMLENGQRGVLLTLNLQTDIEQIEVILHNQEKFNQMSQLAKNWSQFYTLDLFEKEIQKVISV